MRQQMKSSAYPLKVADVKKIVVATPTFRDRCVIIRGKPQMLNHTQLEYNAGTRMVIASTAYDLLIGLR